MICARATDRWGGNGLFVYSFSHSWTAWLRVPNVAILATTEDVTCSYPNPNHSGMNCHLLKISGKCYDGNGRYLSLGLSTHLSTDGTESAWSTSAGSPNRLVFIVRRSRRQR